MLAVGQEGEKKTAIVEVQRKKIKVLWDVSMINLNTAFYFMPQKDQMNSNIHIHIMELCA